MLKLSGGFEPSALSRACNAEAEDEEEDDEEDNDEAEGAKCRCAAAAATAAAAGTTTGSVRFGGILYFAREIPKQLANHRTVIIHGFAPNTEKKYFAEGKDSPVPAS